MSISRRSFLKSSAATAVTSTGIPYLLHSSYASKLADTTSPNKWRGRVAINFNKSAVTDYANKKVNKEVISKMVDETIMLLTGKKEVGEAWKEIFPANLTENSKIAIKTNFYAPNLMPPPEALLAIVAGLRKMVINGKEFTGAITIYEGNTSNTFAGVGYNEADFTKLNVKLEKVSSFPAKTDLPSGESGYAKVVEDADFLFNVFSARGHDSFAEGLSLGFKSHYGTYSTSGPNIHGSNGGFSKRACNLLCSGVISKKQVLTLSSRRLTPVQAK
ncbi:MAG: DUF362 domain-containing protein [Chitinispirillaceae bacterium]|nr:DUF362 domain-containing protein [Chitinispirillaceae bacterium]